MREFNMRLQSIITPNKYAKFAERIVSAIRAYHYAMKRNIPSLAFDRLGRRLGAMQATRGHLIRDLSEILNPISLVRYFEFDFCLRQLPKAPKTILDISSPRLFPLYIASQLKNTKFILLNPDPFDVELSKYCIKLLGLDNVEIYNYGVRGLLNTHKKSFDFVSSISVIEHVAGEYDDTKALSFMIEYLKPGGVLALTVPLSENKRHEDEYLPDGCKPYEGTHEVQGKNGRFFFQRLYTKASINERLLCRLHAHEVSLSWWGEREKGFYEHYRNSSAYNHGNDCRSFIDNFCQYKSYTEMPGMGICGIRITD